MRLARRGIVEGMSWMRQEGRGIVGHESNPIALGNLVGLLLGNLVMAELDEAGAQGGGARGRE